MSTFSIQYLECYFPQIGDVVTIKFFAIVPGYFIQEYRLRIEQFQIFVNRSVKSPLESARAFPKFDRISLVCSKKLLKFAKDGCYMDLIWIVFIIKYLLSRMDRAGDDNDFGNVFFAACLTNTTSHGKKFCFCAGDKGCMVSRLDQRVVTYVNV